jgi:hypothetical protein
VITYRYFFDMSDEEKSAAPGLARGIIKSASDARSAGCGRTWICLEGGDHAAGHNQCIG